MICKWKFYVLSLLLFSWVWLNIVILVYWCLAAWLARVGRLQRLFYEMFAFVIQWLMYRDLLTNLLAQAHVHAYNRNGRGWRKDYGNLLKHQAVSVIEINWQFISFSKLIRDLANQALLARVEIPICRAISSLKNMIACKKKELTERGWPTDWHGNLSRKPDLGKCLLQWVECIYFKSPFK